MHNHKIIIVGHGGFAREVAWLIKDITKSRGGFSCVGHVVSDLSTHSPSTSIHRAHGLLGDFTWLKKNREQWTSLTIGIGTPSTRAKIFSQLSEMFPDAEWPALVHPSVQYDHDSCTVGRGSIVCANVVGTVNFKIAEACLVNLSCTIGHEAEIGLGSVINPSVNISGGVKIGARVLVGTGAQILQDLNVGEDASVGAGAVVVKDVAPGTTVVGIPAKPFTPK